MPISIGAEAEVSLACLFDVQQEATFVQTGKNTKGGNYSYYKVRDLLGPLTPFLKKHRCVVLFSTEDPSCTGGFVKVQGAQDVAPKDKLVTYAFTKVTARIQAVGNVDDFVEVTSFGYKVDQTSDKALGAYTVGARYALMELCNVEGDFDPDDDNHDVRGNDIMANIFPKNPIAHLGQTPQGAAVPQNTTNNLLAELGL